jgi:hypothetical protein
VWATDFRRALMAREHLKVERYKDQFYPALLSWQFGSFLNGLAKNPRTFPSFADYFTPYWVNQPFTEKRVEDAPYSLEVAADVTLAAKLGLLSQRAFVAMNPTDTR